jgi:aminomethyltransferase
MSTALRRTPLHARHVELGARMVPFAGWEMPVYYVGITEEHRAVRARAGVFDVSHMGQIEVSGEGSKAFLQRVLSNDLDRLRTRQAQYTLLPNEQGGIVDDLIAYRLGTDRWLLVVNASNVDADFAHLQAQGPGGGVELVDRSADYGMVALQGPVAMEVLETLWDRGNPPLDGLNEFEVMEGKVGGIKCLIARTGYTGEPGVELIPSWADTEPLFDALLRSREHGVVPCGLGARDTLRLEVCYPLHGNDISPETNAIEAGLGWVCALDKDFTGADVLRRVKAEGPKRRLVALRMLDRAIPRAGHPLLHEGERIGEVTSGTLSPSLDRGIGLGYLRADLAAPGSVVQVDVRGRARDAEVAQKPLYRKEI